MYLDLSGIIHLVFNPLSNFSCNEYHLFVVYLLGNYHYADFTACLDSVGFLNALVGGAYFLKLLETLDVVFVIFVSCAGSCSGDSVCCLDQSGDNGLGLNIAVVSLDSVDYLGAFLVLAAHVNAYLNVRTFDLIAQRLADIVEQTCTSCKVCVNTKLGSHYACQMCDLDRMVEHVLTVGGSVSETADKAYQLVIDPVNIGSRG